MQSIIHIEALILKLENGGIFNFMTTKPDSGYYVKFIPALI